MVDLKSLVIALSLMFTDMTVCFEDNTGNSRDGATLVFLTSLAVLASHLKLFRKFFIKGSFILLLAEICACLIIFELALRFLWKFIQDAVAANTERFLEDLYDRKNMQNVFCYMCCGRKNCPKFISGLFLKVLSFGFLTAAILTL